MDMSYKCNITPIEIRRFLKEKGYDSKPEKNKNSLFTCNMWVGDKKLLIEKKEYKCWKTAELETNKIFYNKLCKEKN